MNATVQTQTFSVVVNLKDYVYKVVQAGQDSETAQGNALRRFLEYSSSVPDVIGSLGDIAKGTEDKGIKSRIAELKSVYQAVQHGLELTEGAGYHSAVKASRELLKSIGILPNGEARKTEQEKEKARKNKALASMLSDGLDVQEAVARYEQGQQEQQEQQSLLEDAATAVCVEWGHALARKVAKIVLEMTKDVDKVKSATL